MKALVYTQPHQLQWQQVEDAQAATGEVVLKIDAVGICGSDMHAWHGHDPRRKPGLILGHEFAGEVVQSRSDAITEGMRVTGNPLIACGYCEYCVQGRNNLCVNRTMVGMTRPGAFAERMAIPASCLISIPEGMPANHAALTEPAATALHAISISQAHLTKPISDCRTLILGGGAIGMFCALLLKHHTAGECSVAELNPLRRESISLATGAKAFDPIKDPALADSYDYVIDAVGAKATRNTALEAVKPGGVVMHIGLMDWASEIDMRKLTLAEITLLGAYTYTQKDLCQALELLHQGALGPLDWIATRPLAQGAGAFTGLDKGEIPSAKVVLVS